MIFGFPSIITSSTSQDPELMNLGVLYKMVLLRVRGLSAGSLWASYFSYFLFNIISQ